MFNFMVFNYSKAQGWKKFPTFISASHLAVSQFSFNTIFLIMLHRVHVIFVFFLSVYEMLLFSVSFLQVWHARQGHLTPKMKSCGVIASSLSCHSKRAFSELITPSSTTPSRSPPLPTVSKSRRRSPHWHHPTLCLLHLLPPLHCWATPAESAAGRGSCQLTMQSI